MLFSVAVNSDPGVGSPPALRSVRPRGVEKCAQVMHQVRFLPELVWTLLPRAFHN